MKTFMKGYVYCTTDIIFFNMESIHKLLPSPSCSVCPLPVGQHILLVGLCGFRLVLYHSLERWLRVHFVLLLQCKLGINTFLFK